MKLIDALNIFTGVMDRDSSDSTIAPDDYREMVNGENGYTNEQLNGSVVNIPSNLLIGNPHLDPAGSYKDVGTCEDKTGESVIYFLAETGGNNGIFRWYRNRPGYANGVIEKIYTLENHALYSKRQTNPFGFLQQTEFAITGCALVNNLLFWTNNGRPPRCFDIVRANETNKKRKFNISFNRSQFDTVSTYVLDLYAKNTLVPVFTMTWTSASTTYAGRTQDFINYYLANATASAWLAVVDQSGYPEVEITQVGQYVLNITETSSNPVTYPSVAIPENFYPDYDAGILPAATFDLFTEDYIDLIKYLPECCPEVDAGRDPAKSGLSLIANKVFQFRLRYRYKNFEKSRMGAISNIAIYSIDGSGNQVPTSDNFIDITFTDPRLENKGLVSMIDKIDLLVREHNEGQWRVFQRLNQYEFAGTGLQQTYRFYNDEATIEIVPVIDEVEQIDAVPNKSKSLENAEDRIFLAGNTEGYDTVNVDAEVNIAYPTNPEGEDRFSICGIISIETAMDLYANLGYNQPIWDDDSGNIGWGGFVPGLATFENGMVVQNFADPTNIRGFIPYLAGTDRYAISEQNTRLSDFVTAPQHLTFGGGGVVWAVTPNGIQEIQTYGMDVVSSVRSNPFGLGAAATTHSDNGSYLIGDTDGGNFGMFFSRFEIRGVKAGKYILRVASPKEVTLELLNNGSLEYQNTSCPLFQIAGQQGFEFEVTVGNTQAVINPLTKRKTVFVGVTKVPDFTNINPAIGSGSSRIIFGYLTDEYNVSPTDYLTGLTRPRINYGKVFPYTVAPIAPWRTVYDDLVGVCDHNGFFWVSRQGGASYGLLQSAPVQVGNYTAVSPVISVYVQDANTMTYPTDKSALISVTMPTDAEISTKRRTHITGFVKDDDTEPITGANVVLFRGQWQHTDINGYYDIVTYADILFPTANKKQIKLLFQSASVQTILQIFGGTDNYFITASTTITFGISAGEYYDQNAFFVATVIFTILNSKESETVWKPGSDIGFGIVYYDAADRRCAVIPVDEKHILFSTEADENDTIQPDGGRILSWKIFHQPPDWAVKYQWVRTLNLQHGLYIQWAINKAIYVDDIGNNVGYTLGASTQARIDFDNVAFYAINKFPGAIIDFGFQVGDRIRVREDATGVTLTQYVEAEIIKIVEPYFYIRKTNNFEFKAGMLVELYHPRDQADVNIYYEFGECYPVSWGTFGNECKKYHVGESGDQSYGLLPFTQVTPATGTFQSGNAWSRLRRYPLNVTSATQNTAAINGGEIVRQVFDGSISDFYSSYDEDIGRPNTTELLGLVYKPASIRFSDLYRQGAKINDLCTFRALNEKTFNFEYGLINKLQIVKKDVLYAIFHNSYTVSMYLNKAVLKDLTGANIVAISDDVIARTTDMQRTFGTQDPATIQVNDEGDIFGYDEGQGIAWRASGNGMIDISEYLMKGWWQDISKKRRLRSRKVNAVATYDIAKDKYIITLPLSAQRTTSYPKTTVCLPDYDGTFTLAVLVQPQNTVLFSVNVTGSGSTKTVIKNNLKAIGWTVQNDKKCNCFDVVAPDMSFAGSNLIIKTIYYDLITGVDSTCDGVGGWIAEGAWVNDGNKWKYGNLIGANSSSLALDISAMLPNTTYLLNFTLTQAPTNPDFKLTITVDGVGLLPVINPVVSQTVSRIFNSGSLTDKSLVLEASNPNNTTEYISIDNVRLINVSGVTKLYTFPIDLGQAADANVATPAYTLSFQKESAQIKKQGWKSFYKFYPEFYGKLRNDVLMFKNGDLYLAGAGVGTNNFFGTQYSRTITYVVNDGSGATKGFKAMSTRSEVAQEATALVIAPNAEYPLGMVSRLLRTKFRIYNADFYSEILRDMTTPGYNTQTDALLNGRPLQGEEMTVTIDDNSLSDGAIKDAKTTYFYISKFPNA